MTLLLPWKLAAVALFVCVGGPASAQGSHDPTELVAAQVEAMKALGKMNGVWRGPAWTLLPSGQRKQLIQTERIGTLLQGTLKAVEGRGYDDDGKLIFNSFGVISFDPTTRTYNLRSYAQGRVGNFVIIPTDDGYTWSIPAGPATIRYTATIKDNKLHQTGVRIVAGVEPLQIFEMDLTRVSETTWPSAGEIGPK